MGPLCCGAWYGIFRLFGCRKGSALSRGLGRGHNGLKSVVRDYFYYSHCISSWLFIIIHFFRQKTNFGILFYLLWLWFNTQWISDSWFVPKGCKYSIQYARHYNPRFVYFLHHFWKPETFFKELFCKILTLCTVSIQERFQIKTRVRYI